LISGVAPFYKKPIFILQQVSTLCANWHGWFLSKNIKMPVSFVSRPLT
jgi:hypothetical protein